MRSRELRAPVLQLPVEQLRLLGRALPHREVAVLHRQLGKLGLSPEHGRGVQRLELPGEHAERPSVGDDVVHPDDQ